VLAAAARLMAGGEARNDDDTDNNAKADGRQSGPPSGDAYAVGVRRGRSKFISYRKSTVFTHLVRYHPQPEA
jgi:hypothetical protein